MHWLKQNRFDQLHNTVSKPCLHSLQRQNSIKKLLLRYYGLLSVICTSSCASPCPACRTSPQLKLLPVHCKAQADNMTKRYSKSKMRLVTIAVTLAELQ